MSISCEDCTRIKAKLSSFPVNRRKESMIRILDGEAILLVQADSIKSVPGESGHLGVKFYQFGPFSPLDSFQLKDVRDLNRLKWQIGLLCQALSSIKS